MFQDPEQFQPPRGFQQSGVRVANARAIMSLIAVEPGVSPAEISRKAGLAPQTVSRILGDLESAGLVRRDQVRRGLRGQPATPYYLDERGEFSIGCEISWRHCMVQLVDLSGAVLADHRWTYTYPDPRVVFDEIAAIIKLMTAGFAPQERAKVKLIGVAAPSGFARNLDLLGAERQQMELWRETDMHRRLEHVTGLSAQVFNDGNAACWGELGVRPAPLPANFVYFQIGTFIAAGLVAQSKLWEGPSGNSANLGSMLVTDRHGHQNFVHLIASIMAFETKLKAAGIALPAGDPLNWDWAAFGPTLDEWIDDAGRAIAKAIVNTSAVIEFNKAIVDGALPRPTVRRIVDSVAHHLALLPVLTADRAEVVMGQLGVAAGSKGAAQLPIYRKYFSRELEHLSG